MDQNFEIGIEITGNKAALYNSIDGTKEIIVPIMATAFEQAMRAGDRSAITAFEIIYSVCASVVQAMPGLSGTFTEKFFRGSDHFKK